ncbi:MAG: hypothetical protein JNJ57_13625 [Saprospiraceae bacterium]|nr:hypothetical protein [Saprospiraceae bacterium]
MDSQSIKNAAYLRQMYQLTLEDYQESIQHGRNTATQLQSLVNSHDLAFLAEKLKNACGVVSRQKVFKLELDTGMLPMVLAYVRSRPELLQHTAIAVYYFGYLSLTEPLNDESFFSLKTCLQTAGQQFPVEELRDVYLIAINFCIHRINLREEVYLKEVFDLYRQGLDSGVFLDQGGISRFTYTNIAFAGLRLNAYEWVLDFLHKYRDYLPEAQKHGTYSFNLARYYCEKGDFEQAMPLLQTMDFDDVLHNLTAKAMLAKMYVDTGEIVALDSLLSSLGAYLRRKKQVTEQQRLAYKNFIRFVKRIANQSWMSKRKVEVLKLEIAATPLVAEKDWLMRIIDAK